MVYRFRSTGAGKSGGLADVAKALPQALKALHQQVAIALPAYRSVPGKEDAELVLETELTHWPHTQYRVLKRDLDGVPIYLIDCPAYFDRPALYAENNQAYADNGERFGFSLQRVWTYCRNSVFSLTSFMRMIGTQA